MLGRTNAAFQQPVAHWWLFATGSRSPTAQADSTGSYAGGAHDGNRKGLRCRHDGEWAALLRINGDPLAMLYWVLYCCVLINRDVQCQHAFAITTAMPLLLQVITVEPGGLTEDHSKKARLLVVS